MGYQEDLARLYARVSRLQRKGGLNLIEIAAPRPGEAVMDIGCGTGELTLELARRVGESGRVVGVDPDLERLKVAEEAMPGYMINLDYEPGRAEALTQFADESFDLIFSNYALQAADDLVACAREIARCLRPGGRCVLQLPFEIAELPGELLHLTGADSKIAASPFKGTDAQGWRDLMLAEGFMLRQAEAFDVWEHFDDLNAFYEWMEGTTHGLFQAARVPPERHAALARDFARGQRVKLIRAVRIVARKPKTTIK